MRPSIFGKTLLLFSFAFVALAQQPATRAEQIQQQRIETAKIPVTPDTDPIEEAVSWANQNGLLTLFSNGWKGLSPTIGGLVNGSGFGGGLQFLRADLREGNLIVRSSARVSSKFYQLYDAEIGMPKLFDGKMYLDLYARHRNYSELPYYGPGRDSVRTGRTNYRMEDTTFDFSAGIIPAKHVRLGITGGYLDMNIGPGASKDFASTDATYTDQQTPGINTQSDFYRGGVLTHIDFRDNPYGPRAGGQYYGRFDTYKDRSEMAYSFRRLTAEAQQFVPLFNKKRVIAARAKTILSYPAGGDRVPFYLQPTLGAADDLRGFPAFRFYDNNSFVMNAEWRWEILSGVEGALFVDAGKVFRQPTQLNFGNLEKSYGGGIRFRSPGTKAMIMRVDVAASREGIQFWFVFNDVFAAPQVRTGRELSPPPGRLP